MTRPVLRRRLLTGASSLVVPALAGCLDNNDQDQREPQPDQSTDSPDEAGANTQTAIDTDENEPTPPNSLDLQEANVVGVSIEQDNGTYTIAVTLHHDDDGEEGYANWWQVERPDGTRLGRRELLHPHSEQPFTRSKTIEIPADVSCLVVRGHDQTHEYGGVAMLVSLESGEMRAVDQGDERRVFDETDCP